VAGRSRARGLSTIADQASSNPNRFQRPEQPGPRLAHRHQPRFPKAALGGGTNAGGSSRPRSPVGARSTEIGKAWFAK